MFEEAIELIVHDTIANFPKKINKPIVLFLEKPRFSRFLDLMRLQKHVNMTPCFVAEMKGGNVIYFCREIVDVLTKGFSKEKKKRFIEAVTLHELFHIWNNIDPSSESNALFSEHLVHQELEKMYPQHSKLLKSFLKRKQKKAS